jgi:hypothetical protein
MGGLLKNERPTSNIDIAAKRRKKHKTKISGLVNSMSYNEQKSNFRLFTNPSKFNDLTKSCDFYSNPPLTKTYGGAIMHI